MKCPECHTTMTPGFIPTGGGLFFFRAQEDTELFPFAEALPGTSSWFRLARLEAYRCNHCQLVLFRYGKQIDEPKEFQHK